MPRNQTITFSQTLVSEECCNCGILFAFPSELKGQLLDDRERQFYCPNGHPQHYVGETDAQKYKRQRDEVTRKLASAREDIRIEIAAHAATKGQLTRARKRADAGVCQHCHRHFANVERHVAKQHPDLSQAHA